MAKKRKKFTRGMVKTYPSGRQVVLLKNDEEREMHGRGNPYTRRKGIESGEIEPKLYEPKESGQDDASAELQAQPLGDLQCSWDKAFCGEDCTLCDTCNRRHPTKQSKLNTPAELAREEQKRLRGLAIDRLYDPLADEPDKTLIAKTIKEIEREEREKKELAEMQPQDTIEIGLAEFEAELANMQEGEWYSLTPPKQRRREYTDTDLWRYARDGAKRARTAVLDYMEFNKFDWWIGLSFKPEYTDEQRKEAAQHWLTVLKKRINGVKYICAPER